MELVVPYAPHPGQQQFHDSRARFRVLACGRRWGKTMAALNEAVRVAVRKPKSLVWVVAPVYQQSLIPWRLLNEYLPQELVKSKSLSQYSVELLNGSVLAFKSAEHPDSLRGAGLDFLVVDEAAQVKREAWEEALRPALADRLGRAVFISTPKGYNWFYELWLRGNGDDPEYKSFAFPTLSNPHIAPKEIEEARRTLPELVFRQEFLAEFLKDLGAVFRGVEECLGAQPSGPREGEEYILGVDLAKYEDFTVLTVMDGRGNVVHFDRFKDIDWTIQKGRIRATAERYNGARIVLDATGAGDPIYDDLRGLGLDVKGVKLSGPMKERLVTNLAMHIEQRKIRLPAVPQLVDELRVFGYETTDSGNIRYSAPSGFYDDCVISLALAAWELKRRTQAGEETAAACGKSDLSEYAGDNLAQYRTAPNLEQLRMPLGGVIRSGP